MTGRSEHLYRVGVGVLGLAAACVWPLVFYALARPNTDYSWDLMKWPTEVARWGRLGLFWSFWGPPIWAWLGLSLGRRRLFIGGVVGLVVFYSLDLLTGYEWERGTALAWGRPALGIGEYLWSWDQIPGPVRLAEEVVLPFSSGLLLMVTLRSQLRATRSTGLLFGLLSAACFGYAVFWSLNEDGGRYVLDGVRGVILPHNVVLSGVSAVLWIAFPIAAAVWGYLGLRPNLRSSVCALTATHALLLVALTGIAWFHRAAIFSIAYSWQVFTILTDQGYVAAMACGVVAGPLAWQAAARALASAGRQCDAS